MYAGPFKEDDTTNATHTLHRAAQHVLLPGGGAAGGRPIGGGLPAAGSRHFAKGASTSSGRGIVNDRILELAKQLTDSGVPLEIATARAEVQVLPQQCYCKACVIG